MRDIVMQQQHGAQRQGAAAAGGQYGAFNHNGFQQNGGLRNFLQIFTQQPQQQNFPKNSENKGLENKFGQNNCFLNVVIQALWQIRSFREKFNSWDKHSHKANQNTENCVHCALKSVFVQYQYSDNQLIPPTTLREALHKTFAQEARFQMGEMDDAAETLEAILNCLKDVSEGDVETVPGVVFGIDVEKTVHCPNCNTSSQPEIDCHFIEYTYQSPLCRYREVHREYTFGKLIKEVGQEWKSCPREDKSKRPLCQTKLQVKRKLLNVPEVFSIGMVWESTQPTVEEIMSSLSIIPGELEINQIFEIDWPHPIYFRFRGMICYYGKHYACYFFDEKLGKWFVFDDATVKMVGEWADVLTKSRLGHFHPSVLLFERKPNQAIPPRVKVVIPEPTPPSIDNNQNNSNDNEANMEVCDNNGASPSVSQSVIVLSDINQRITRGFNCPPGYSIVPIQKRPVKIPSSKPGYSFINVKSLQ